jgi:hypothetical protein
MEYIVSGHSGETGEQFKIPYNITIVFYANPGKTCFVPGDKESMDFVVDSIKSETHHVHSYGETIHNYQVEFHSNASKYEGVAVIKPDGYDFLPLSESLTLEEICRKVQRHNNRRPATLYCFFCRGSTFEWDSMDFGFDGNMSNDKMHYFEEDITTGFVKSKTPTSTGPKSKKRKSKKWSPNRAKSKSSKAKRDIKSK